MIFLTACLLCVDTRNGLSFHCITAPILTAFLISWLTSLLPSFVRPVIQFVVGESFVALCVVDCYCQIYFGAPITPHVLTNILLSDVRETKEFILAFVSLNNIVTKWRIAVLLLLALLYPATLFLKYQLPVPKSRKMKVAGVLALALCAIYEVLPTYRYIQLFLQKQNMEKIEGLIFRHYHEEIPTPLHRMVFACYATSQSSNALNEIRRSTFSAGIDSCTYKSPHIVLIIGESYNKHHSSLYGYHLPTTPLQQERNEKDELFLFTDVVSPWNITSNVFLDMFSLWENGATEDLSEYPLFPILFRRAGYSVSFFSNQYQLKGFRKGATNQAGHFFLADVELSDSLFSYRNQRSSKYDMGLVNQIKSRRHEVVPADYTLDIIHLIGQHFDYSMRYPDSLGWFSIDDYVERDLQNDEKEIVMHYDNATKYNDMVLDEILTVYEKEDAIVVFVSDHGEEVYDDFPMSGRLFQEPTALQAKAEYEVPMWIWCSDLYRENHQDIVQFIFESANKPFMTDGTPQFLLSLAGIESEWLDDSRNILSNNYQYKPRIINGGTDFDLLMGLR